MQIPCAIAFKNFRLSAEWLDEYHRLAQWGCILTGLKLHRSPGLEKGLKKWRLVGRASQADPPPRIQVTNSRQLTGFARQTSIVFCGSAAEKQTVHESTDRAEGQAQVLSDHADLLREFAAARRLRVYDHRVRRDRAL